MWGTVSNLQHWHHSELVAPVSDRNKAVFSQPDLKHFKRTQPLLGRLWQRGLYDRHFMNSCKVLLLAAHLSVQHSLIHDDDSGSVLARAPARVEVSLRSY